MNSLGKWRHLLGMLAALAIRPDLTGAKLTIGETVLRSVPTELFGQFLERPSWGGEFGPEAVCDAEGRLSPEIERHLAGMHTTLVRFPVGTDGDYIDWTDMIDLPNRPKRPDTVGHTGQVVGNRFGFDEYFSLARRMGWKTILVTNLRDALYKKKPLADAAAHAAALVAYAGTHTGLDTSLPPVPLAAVQVGNEGWFFWPPKAEERRRLDLADEDACARWLRECLVAYADAIHAVRPGIPLIADAPRPLDGGGLENNAAAVWRAAVDHPDIRSRYRYLAAHAYAPLGLWHTELAGQKVASDTLTADQVWHGLIATLGRYDGQGQAVADSAAYADIRSLGYRVAVTEWNWNGWDFAKRFPRSEFQEGLPAALSVAGFLHGMMRDSAVDLATQSMLLGTRWGITAVRVAADGRVGYLPQGEVTRIYAAHHGSALLESKLEDPGHVSPIPRFTTWWPAVDRLARLDAIVTADSVAWYIHLINRDRTQPTPLEIILPGEATRSGEATIHQLTGEPHSTTTTAGGMQRGQTEVLWDKKTLSLVLPAASVTVAVVPRKLPTPPLPAPISPE